MNTQGRTIWVFNIIKSTVKINLKELLKDSPFFLKERKTLRGYIMGKSCSISMRIPLEYFMGGHLSEYSSWLWPSGDVDRKAH